MINPQPIGEFSEYLEEGAKLLNGQYTIQKFLNAGGFGITYLATDSLGRNVVIKECYPGALCRRQQSTVSVRSRAYENQFAKSIELFLHEAQNLAKLDHPNIVGVHQVFQDNQTAYMALDYIEGYELLDVINDKKSEKTAKFIVQLVPKILDAVKYIHENTILHRDISPDNILINTDGEPILIDFGAARVEAINTNRVLSTLSVVKDGYSPQEFYLAGSQQNESSDLYALGACIYHYISGQLPPNSQLRLATRAEGKEEPYIPLAGRIKGYPPNFLEAIDKSLNLIPKDRFQNATEWLNIIQMQETAFANTNKHLDTDFRKSIVASSSGKRLMLGLSSGILVAVFAVFFALNAEGGKIEVILDVLAPDVKTIADNTLDAEIDAYENVKIGGIETVIEEVENTQILIASTDQNNVPESVGDTQGPIIKKSVEKNKVNILNEQIVFAHWDIEMPYKSKIRAVNNTNLELIIRVNSDADTAISGNWIKQGIAIYEVSGTPLYKGATVANIILDNLRVDPDGYARYVVSFKKPGNTQSETGLLAVHAIRSVGLANGIEVTQNGKTGIWRTIVTNVTEKKPHGLREGDILLRELITGNRLSSSDVFEKTVNTLAARNNSTAEFEIRRNGKLIKIDMDLAVGS